MSRNFFANRSNSVKSLWMAMVFFSRIYPFFESGMIACKLGRYINVAVINRILLDFGMKKEELGWVWAGEGQIGSCREAGNGRFWGWVSRGKAILTASLLTELHVLSPFASAAF